MIFWNFIIFWVFFEIWSYFDLHALFLYIGYCIFQYLNIKCLHEEYKWHLNQIMNSDTKILKKMLFSIIFIYYYTVNTVRDLYNHNWKPYTILRFKVFFQTSYGYGGNHVKITCVWGHHTRLVERVRWHTIALCKAYGPHCSPFYMRLSYFNRKHV